MPTEVNDQITDAVTQTNVKVVAEAPAMAMGQLYQTSTHSMALAMENAVTAQQNMNITAQAATTAGVTAILSAAAGGGEQSPDTMVSLLTALKTLQSTNVEQS
jgi:hypothetical protein